MISGLTKSYLVELDARAAQGDTRARDYGDVCRLEFEQHLERCVLAPAKRDRDEGRAECGTPFLVAEAPVQTVIVTTSTAGHVNPHWQQGDSTIVEPDTARRVTCDSTAPSPLRMLMIPSRPNAPRQGSLF